MKTAAAKRSLYLFFAVLIVSGVILAPQTVSAQPDGKDIVEKANELMRGNTSKAQLRMKIVRPSWEREMQLKTWSLGNDFTMIYIESPPRDEGTTFLKRKNQIWNWVPRVGRVVKLPPSMMMQSWMGSDFTNDDLVEEASIVTDYHHKVVGDTTINGYDCWEISLKPKPEKAVVWDEVIMHIAKEHYYELRTEFYDEEGEMVNMMTGSEIEEFENRTLPSRYEMIPMDKEGHKTIMIYENVEFNIDIPERFFTIQNMKRLD